MPGYKTSGAIAESEGGVPLYRRIARTLQTEIARGIYHAGSQLPSETELMQRFGVSRHTVRAAIRRLQDAGLVKSRHGFGTIVQNPGAGQHYIHQVNTILDLFPLDAEPHYDPIDGTLIELPAWARFFPVLDDGCKWLHITGDRRKPGTAKPFNEVELFIAARFAGVARMVGASSGSIYTALEAIYGETIVEVEQVIAGFRADGVRGAKVGLKKGDSGIEVRSLHRVSSDGEVGIYTLNRFTTEDYSFSMILRRHDGGRS